MTPVDPRFFVVNDAEYSARFVDDDRVSWTNPRGRILTPLETPSKYEVDRPFARPRVLQLTRYDPGCSAYRYHSAMNSTLLRQGTSAFVRYEHDNPHCDLRQYDGMLQREGTRRLFETADVVHVHMEYSTLSIAHLMGRWPDRRRQLLVRHYHGSQPTIESEPTVLVENAMDDNERAVQVGARLYHQRFSDRMHWLPIPMPVLDYVGLALEHWRPLEMRKRPVIRIAHSPTHAPIKGTIVLQTAISDLQLKGVPIELVMIQGKSHAEALALKATCDLTFDSFWLGIQGSGLEAACMGQAVIAGDPQVRDEYVRAIGHCPYTFVEGFEDLRSTIERLVTDESFRLQEARRVSQYVQAYHDYPVVGERYWSIIAAECAARGLHAAETEDIDERKDAAAAVEA